MFKTRAKHGYQSAADDGAGAAGGGAAAAGAGAGQGAAAAAGGEGGAAAAGAGAGAAAASLLATGKEVPAGQEGGQGEAAPADRIPEKYRVNKADGTLDWEASTVKLAEGLDAANKRIGTGDLPPATPEEYAPEGLPDGVSFDELKADPMYQTFLKGAHELGLTNKQMSYVLNEYLARAPEIAAGAQQVDAEAAVAELKKTWTTEADFKQNLGHAYRATAAIASKAGLDVAAIEASPLGSNPLFLRLMASLGPEFAEDTAGRGSELAAHDFDSQLAEIRSHAGYGDANHPEHKALMARKTALYERRYGKGQAPGVTTIPVKK